MTATAAARELRATEFTAAVNISAPGDRSLPTGFKARSTFAKGRCTGSRYDNADISPGKCREAESIRDILALKRSRGDSATAIKRLTFRGDIETFSVPLQQSNNTRRLENSIPPNTPR